LNSLLLPGIVLAGSLVALAVALLRRRKTHEQLPHGTRLWVSATAAAGIAWAAYAGGLHLSVAVGLGLVIGLAMYGVTGAPPSA